MSCCNLCSIQTFSSLVCVRGAGLHTAYSVISQRVAFGPISPFALALEYEDVLKRPGLIAGITTEEIDGFLDYLFREGKLERSVPRLRPSLRDPDDERILELAVQCGATIVTHNSRDFDGAGRFGVHVYAPSDILMRLENRT